MNNFQKILLLVITVFSYYIRIKLLERVHNCTDNCFTRFMTFNNIVSLMIIAIPFIVFTNVESKLIAMSILLLLNSQLLFIEIQYLNWQKNDYKKIKKM